MKKRVFGIKKVLGIVLLFLLSLFIVNAQYECEWDGDCPGGKCVIEEAGSHCEYPLTQPSEPSAEYPLTQPSEPSATLEETFEDLPVQPSEQPPVTPIMVEEEYCGNGKIDRDIGEECEVDEHCAVLGGGPYTCSFECKCVPYQVSEQPPVTPPIVEEKYCGNGVVDSGEQCDGLNQASADQYCPSGYFCSSVCSCEPREVVRECPSGTVPVKGEGVFYCMSIIESSESELPKLSLTCKGRTFVIPEGKQTTELSFTLPWIPDSAFLIKNGESIPVSFDNKKVVLNLGEGDYLMSVVKNDKEYKLPFKVLKVKVAPRVKPAVKPASYEVLVHAQNDDEEAGRELVDYLKKLGLNAGFSNSKNVEDVSTSEIVIFLGGHLANNLVSKYFPDISESLFNLNSNRFVAKRGDQFVIALAGWCGDGTLDAIDELKQEVDFELEMSKDVSNAKSSKKKSSKKVGNAKLILKKLKNKRGNKISCMPEPPTILEDLKSGGKERTSKKRTDCPNARVCDKVCFMKELELYNTDDEHFIVPTSRRFRWDNNKRVCKCTILGVILRVFSEIPNIDLTKANKEVLFNGIVPIDVELYCYGAFGDINLAYDVDQAITNARNAIKRKYERANRDKQARIINDLLRKRGCDGREVCREYCKYELYQCKNGRRNPEFTREDGSRPFEDYPSNNCAGYTKAIANYYFSRDASCRCIFLDENEEREHDLDPDYMTPLIVNYFCDKINEREE